MGQLELEKAQKIKRFSFKIAQEINLLLKCEKSNLPGGGMPGGTGGIGGPEGGMLGAVGIALGTGTAMTAGGMTTGAGASVAAAIGAGGASANSW